MKNPVHAARLVLCLASLSAAAVASEARAQGAAIILRCDISSTRIRNGVTQPPTQDVSIKKIAPNSWQDWQADKSQWSDNFCLTRGVECQFQDTFISLKFNFQDSGYAETVINRNTGAYKDTSFISMVAPDTNEKTEIRDSSTGQCALTSDPAAAESRKF